MLAKITSASEINQRLGINKEIESEFKNILANKLIFTKFHPIVCLATGDVVGYEALSSGPEASIFENPAYLFEIAERLALLEDLDMLCREKAIFNASKLTLDTKSKKLFINIDAASLAYIKHDRDKTMHFLEKYELNIDNVVLEITERAFIKDSRAFLRG